ncbi:MAG: glutamate-5-semialdehyde dehydrogenase [Clostridia bacterium]|nr:glutamate-5-semialdehyde dehydrogenase [Clostridia bacterium]
MTTKEIMACAKECKDFICNASAESKNKALSAMASSIEAHKNEILLANAKDMENARGKISDVMLDRLKLDESRISGMAEGIRNVALLPDPVGEVISRTAGSGGMEIEKVCVPLGVIAIIYESRPNVTSDAAALSLKSGNACVLRCGKEAHGSALAIVSAMKEGLSSCGFPENLIMLVEDISRDSANELMHGNGYIDLLIPRGGAGLIKACLENATVPCIETGTGICHIYVDAYADPDMAVKIVKNAKTSRPSVCNAAEVCLVHKDVCSEFLPKLEKEIPNVELRADENAIKYLSNAKPASETDFDTEFLDYILAVKEVACVEDAVSHILLHSTGHSEAIVTENKDAADYFVKHTDSAAVYVNASTRFTDGGEFGLGCEMGISTQKLHARGPMGLKELTTYKYVVYGNGNVR